MKVHEAERELRAIGAEFKRQTGSHRIWQLPDGSQFIVVNKEGKDMNIHPKKFQRIIGKFPKKNPYNGWANYETWNVVLWVTSDEGSYNRLLFWNNGEHLDADEARDFVEDLYPGGTPDFEGNAKRYDRVNWEEVAVSFNEARGTERQENIGFIPEWSFTFEALPDDVEDRPGFNFLHAKEIPPAMWAWEPDAKSIAAWLTRSGIKVSPKNVWNKDAIDQLGFFAESDDGKWFINVDPGPDNPKLSAADIGRLFPRQKKRGKNPRAKMPKLFDPSPIRYDVYGAGPYTSGDEFGKIWAPPPPIGAAWDSDEWGDYEVALLRAMREALIPARPTHEADPTSGTAHVPPSSVGSDFIIWQQDGEDSFHLFFDPGDLK